MQLRGSIPKLLCLQVQQLSFHRLLIRELYDQETQNVFQIVDNHARTMML